MIKCRIMKNLSITGISMNKLWFSMESTLTNKIKFTIKVESII